MTGTEMFLETLENFNHLTLLMAREDSCVCYSGLFSLLNDVICID